MLFAPYVVKAMPSIWIRLAESFLNLSRFKALSSLAALFIWSLVFELNGVFIVCDVSHGEAA